MKDFTEKRFFEPLEVGPYEKERVLGFIKEILSSRNDKIIFAYVHGSFIKSKSFRDIDVGLFVEGKSTFYLESDLSAELSAAVGLEVEVKAINDAPIAFQMAVLRDGVLLFSKNEMKRADFIENVGKRYREYSHFRNIFLEIDGVR
ncbi:MAG: nucleotidyltransferase domain-containing protein [Thermodesulfobacteriota bacterium]